MEAIAFIASFGDQDKHVELPKITGGYYHIYIDRYYFGQILKRDGKWMALLQHPDSLSLDDQQILTEMVAQKEGERADPGNAKKP